jgi:hypothetical protein
MRSETVALKEKVLKYEIEGLKNFESDDSNIIAVQKDKMLGQMALLVKLLGDKNNEAKEWQNKFNNAK